MRHKPPGKPQAEEMSEESCDGLKFSIVVPVYNVAPYLKKCVRSLLAQSVRNYEIILVDDGSDDGSSGICDVFAAKSDKVRVIHKTNGGLSDARNAGIRMAEGEYILFVDGDDFIAGHSLEKIWKTAVEHQKPDVIFLECWKLYGKRKAPMADGINCAVSGLNQKEIWNYLSQLSKYPASAGTKAVRRCLFDSGRLYFQKGLLCEDLEWSPRLFLSISSAAYCDCGYYYYRQGRGGSISNTASMKKAEDVLYIVEKWTGYAKKTNDIHSVRMVCSLMEYVFRHLILGYRDIQGAGGRRQYKKRVKGCAWILGTRKDMPSRCIAAGYTFLGIYLTEKLLSVYLRLRDASVWAKRRRRQLR